MANSTGLAGLMVVASLCTTARGVGGVVRTFVMEGVVTSVRINGYWTVPQVGDRVVYTFSFDSDAPDENPDPRIGQYDGMAKTFLSSAPAWDLGYRPAQISINLKSTGSFGVSSEVTSGIPVWSSSISFGLTDNENTAMPDTSLPVMPYDLQQFETRGFAAHLLFGVFRPGDLGYEDFYGTIDAFYKVAPGDFDKDGHVDQADFTLFVACATGAGVPYDPDQLHPNCTLVPDVNDHISADLDQDGDIDLNDFGRFQKCYSGADRLADPNCGE